jgi:CheY-like chemotaxis protein
MPIHYTPYTVLVIDDDENWCFIAKKLLQKAGIGKEIITSKNGLEAYQILQAISGKGEKMPDMIFLDIKMPVMDGFGFLDEVTKSAELDLSQTKIFICSSSLHPKDKEKAKLYPVIDFITKPLTQEALDGILNSDQ